MTSARAPTHKRAPPRNRSKNVRLLRRATVPRQVRTALPVPLRVQLLPARQVRLKGSKRPMQARPLLKRRLPPLPRLRLPQQQRLAPRVL